MRSVPPNVYIEPSASGGWNIMSGDIRFASSLPFHEWIGRIDRPLTIVAAGPSGRDYAWDQLRSGERMILAVNGAPTFLREVGLKPDLWIISDHTFIPSAALHFANAEGVPLALTIPSAAWLARNRSCELSNRRITLIERVNQWHGVSSLNVPELLKLNGISGHPFLFSENSGAKSKVGWSHSPELGFFSGCTVVFAALQVAVGLGARDIEIIGMDLSSRGRIYDEGDMPQPSVIEEQYDQFILPAFELMAAAIKNSGVRIKNLSKVCPLPAKLFDR
jgi:KDO transferase-3